MYMVYLTGHYFGYVKQYGITSIYILHIWIWNFWDEGSIIFWYQMRAILVVIGSQYRRNARRVAPENS